MKKTIQNLLPMLFLLVFSSIIGYNSGSIFGYKFNQTGIEKEASSTTNTIPDQFTLEDIKAIFPTANSYKVTDIDKAAVFDSNNQRLGDVCHSLPKAKDIKGFAGIIPMIIGFDNNNHILGISVLKNNETPAFIDRVISTGILDKWKGKTREEASILKVDAVTGATMSSSCIIKSIQTSLSDKKTEEAVKDQFTLDEVKSIFHDAASYKILKDNKAEVLNSNSQRIGFILHTLPDCSEFRGFAGNIPLVIGLNNNDAVVGIVAQKNSETQPFFKKVTDSGLLNKWNGKLASEAASLSVDAVTGATMSSSCIIKSVKTRIANNIEEISKEEAQKAKFYKDLTYEILAWICLIISLLAYFKQSSFGKFRKPLIITFVLIPGFLLGRFVSLGLLKAWVSDGIPYTTQIFMTVLVFLAILLPMITGRAFYCIWYCPFGAVQEVFGMITEKKYTPTGKTANILKKLRPVILSIILLLVLFRVNVDIYQFEPFSAFMFKSASVLVLSLAIIFMILSIFVRRPWCNYCCPTGQFLENCRKKEQ